MFTEDLTVFLRDFGVPWSAGGQEYLGLLDTPDQQISPGGFGVMSTMYALRARTEDIRAESLIHGRAITVNGAAYTVREVVAEDDGAFSIVNLSKQ